MTGFKMEVLPFLYSTALGTKKVRVISFHAITFLQYIFRPSHCVRHCAAFRRNKLDFQGGIVFSTLSYFVTILEMKSAFGSKIENTKFL